MVDDKLLAEIVREYEKEHRPTRQGQLNSFAMEATLRDAVSRAALAQRPDGKRYDHQRRIRPEALAEARTRLLKAPLSRCRSFEDLYRLVGETIGSIFGVGDLTIYDTALRIGAKLGIAPARVYLHAGARDGARALELGWRATSLDPVTLPRPMRHLEAGEIENLLCIYKGEFKGRQLSRSRRRPC